jgi:inner membrane protein
MPTVMTHAAVGLALGRVFTARKMPPLFWGCAAVLPVLPDLDVLAFRLGVPYASPLGHRGFTHSLGFALLLGLAAASLTYRRVPAPWWDLLNLFFGIAASHGLLDALTNGGYGVAFFWPLDTTRYFFPWRPVEVSHIGLAFFTRGSRTFLSELFWIWLPTAGLVGVVELYRAAQAARRKKP